MKKIFTIIGTIISSLILTIWFAETLSLYHFGSIPTKLTIIYLISLFSILEYIILSIIYIIYKKVKKEKIGFKKIISMILFFISLILILGFIFIVDVDWLNYYSRGNSAPFYITVIIRGIEFIFPSILLLIIGIFLLKKNNC